MFMRPRNSCEFACSVRRKNGLGGFLALVLVVWLACLNISAEEAKTKVKYHTTDYIGFSLAHASGVNEIVDEKGFANWGQTGYTVDYEDTGFAGSVMVGREILACGTNFRFEADATIANVVASSNQLDPRGLDETVVAEVRWLSSVKAGVVQPFGANAISAAFGVAIGSIENSVTDIDFGPGVPDRVDPDDSFSDDSVKVGTVFQLALERCMSDRWSVRLEAQFYDLGRTRHYVNRIGDARCGPGRTREPCPYSVDNKFEFLRFSVTRSFGE